MRYGRLARASAAVGVIVLAGCGSGSDTASGASARSTLAAAATATAEAKSFTADLPGEVVHVGYEAPDRFLQIEHGEGSSAEANSSDGTEVTTGPYAQTITKIFIGDRAYEADTPEGDQASFDVSDRCPGDSTAGEGILALLRAVAKSRDVHRSGDRYTFTTPDDSRSAALHGDATVRSGYVVAIHLEDQPDSPEATIRISSIGSAPPITAPRTASSAHVDCSP